MKNRQFKAKLRKIGNSQGVLIPYKVITDYKEGDEITLEVITKGQYNGLKEPQNELNVITKTGENKRLVLNPVTGVDEWK